MDNLVNEIKVGDFVTVYNNANEPKDYSWIGHVLKVTAINSPFIVVINKTLKGLVLRLDSRCFQLMPLTQGYVKAALNKEEEK